MFFGTSVKFKISYFWTSMIPAYIIFIARTYSELQTIIIDEKIHILQYIFNFYCDNLGRKIIIAFLILSMAFCMLLRQELSTKKQKMTGTRCIKINFNDRTNESKKNNPSNFPVIETSGFYKVNPGLINYLMGTVFSSGTLSFVSSNSIVVKLFVFFIVQILIWTYVQNSSDSVPNIIMVIFKKDLVSINDRYWILVERKQLKTRLTGIKRIVPFASTDARNRLYIIQEDD